MPFTDLDRQAGRKAMEESLTPLMRALRKFSAGKPGSLPETPLEAVRLAVEQRDRLARILADEDGVERPKILMTAIVVRFEVARSRATIDDDPILIEPGKESAAVSELEAYRDCGHRFRISGFVFVVRVGNKKHRFNYRVERTPEGDEVLNLKGESLLETPTGRERKRRL